MSEVSAKLREEVVRRAGDRCEYCRLSQAGQEAVFHVDHVLPRTAGGATVLSNLALACVSCSLRKWANTGAVDPESGLETPFFNPRSDDWHEHFRWEGAALVPISPIGRTTANALAMNRPLLIAIRLEEIERRRHPPDQTKG